MNADTKVSNLINLLSEIPKGTFVQFQNGELQSYDGILTRGNLFLDGLPALNYYIFMPGELTLYFGTDCPQRIDYQKFVFHATDSIQKIADIAKDYPISKRIVVFFGAWIEAAITKKGGYNYVKAQ